MKLGMSQNELKTLEAKWRDVERDAQDGQKKFDVISAEVEKLKKQIMDSGWSEEAEQRHQRHLNDARRDHRTLTEVCKVISRFPIAHCHPPGAGEQETEGSIPELRLRFPVPRFRSVKSQGTRCLPDHSETL